MANTKKRGGDKLNHLVIVPPDVGDMRFDLLHHLSLGRMMMVGPMVMISNRNREIGRKTTLPAPDDESMSIIDMVVDDVLKTETEEISMVFSWLLDPKLVQAMFVSQKLQPRHGQSTHIAAPRASCLSQKLALRRAHRGGGQRGSGHRCGRL